MKRTILQCTYDIDDHRYPWVAMNLDGSLHGFFNPPIRDFKIGKWQDSVTGAWGDPLPFPRWDVSVREMDRLFDMKNNDPVRRRRINKLTMDDFQ